MSVSFLDKCEPDIMSCPTKINRTFGEVNRNMSDVWCLVPSLYTLFLFLELSITCQYQAPMGGGNGIFRGQRRRESPSCVWISKWAQQGNLAKNCLKWTTENHPLQLLFSPLIAAKWRLGCFSLKSEDGWLVESPGCVSKYFLFFFWKRCKNNLWIDPQNQGFWSVITDAGE